MLIWKTEWVNSVSFHLSFLATLAILHTGVLTPLWVSKMGLLGSFLGEYLIQTLIVLAFTVPYTLAIFGKFSWIALVSNILVLPACKPIMAFGAIAILMGIMSRVLGKLFFSFVWIFLWYVLFVASRLSEMAEPIEGNISLPVMFLIYGILAVSIFVLNVVRNGQR